MYRLKAMTSAKRAGLGKVIDVIGLRPLWVQAVVFWAPLYIVLPILLVQAAAGQGFDWVTALIMFVLCAVLWVCVVSDRIGICERGILLGGFLPFVKLMAITWEHIDLGTLAFVTPYEQAMRALDGGSINRIVRQNRRGPIHGQAVLTFRGPAVHMAKGYTFDSSVSPEQVEKYNAMRVIWCAGIGDRRVERTRNALTTALGGVSGVNVVEVAQRLQSVVQLSKDSRAALAQIPGGETTVQQRL